MIAEEKCTCLHSLFSVLQISMILTEELEEKYLRDWFQLCMERKTWPWKLQLDDLLARAPEIIGALSTKSSKSMSTTSTSTKSEASNSRLKSLVKSTLQELRKDVERDLLNMDRKEVRRIQAKLASSKLKVTPRHLVVPCSHSLASILSLILVLSSTSCPVIQKNVSIELELLPT